MIGNSSSGILEAPCFDLPVINIGDRQRGRLQAESIINCEPTSSDIIEALKRLYSDQFQIKLSKIINPYGTSGASTKIVYILKHFNTEGVIKKFFFNLPTNKVSK